jgi:pimeloyl-ACP methyl ester carboxylesterase
VSEELQLRTYGNPKLPTVIYLPGLHGDWTLITSFRKALDSLAHFVEMTYPRSLTWSIADYATAIESALFKRGIDHGWLLGESFGSQVAWALLENNLSAKDDKKKFFSVDGLILAGGFVKHPLKWGPGLLRLIGRMTPLAVYRLELKIYARYAKFRHRNAPEVLAGIQEFLSRRTELDRRAMSHRLALTSQYDPRTVARRTQVPVYYAAGLVDPLVPFMVVRRWLRANCPGYRSGRTFWLADHNVLATAPDKAAKTIMKWIENHTHP